MRVFLAAAVLACALVMAPIPARLAYADTCPPTCDRIPDTAWIDPSAIPLFSLYGWPGPAGLAVTATPARFRFEEVCGTPTLPGPRNYAVAERATVSNPDEQWQLQVQVMHWRGETWRGGQSAEAIFQAAVAALRDCQLTAPLESPSITVDEPNRMAAVIGGPVIVHQYLVAHPQSSTVSELALWTPSPALREWPAIPDAPVLDALTAPLCQAYIGSCG
jgi:hypothetical protein